jgi:hypothetical protein
MNLPSLPTQTSLPTVREVKESERDKVLKTLSALSAEKRPSSTYNDIRQYERQLGAYWLGPLLGYYWYIPADTDPELVRRIIDRIEQRRAPDPRVAQALGELWVTTKKAKIGDAERDTTLNAYASRLSAYPPEHCLLVLSQLTDTETFFPPWSTVQQKLMPLQSDRFALSKLLKNILPKLQEASAK